MSAQRLPLPWPLCYNVPARSGKGPPDAVLYAVLLAAYIALMCWLGTSPILMFFTAVLVVGVFFFALMTFHLNRSLKTSWSSASAIRPPS